MTKWRGGERPPHVPAAPGYWASGMWVNLLDADVSVSTRGDHELQTWPFRAG